MSRVTRTGADWLAPSSKPTAWQSERWSTWSKVRADYRVAGEHWFKTLCMWLLIGSAAIVVLAVANV